MRSRRSPGDIRRNWTSCPKKSQEDTGKDVLKLDQPGTSKIIYTTNTTVRVNNAEDVDYMSDEEVRSTRLSGVSKAKVQKLVKQSQDYIKTKSVVSKDNFTRHTQRS